ncbi:MAG: LytTR family DNA-binding domain-containing protein [Clostridiales bacterium]|nr:LytTR family DNA-binding domain-containing protein [Clostridiales bacterium]MCC8099194.1 LytTR family DNA-binding domain-containing protein [Clostridiales bacterium]
MLKIGVLEDEAEQAQRLMDYLQRYQMEHSGVTFTVELYDRAISLLDSYQPNFDILFLDIRLPDMLGMEVARRIRKTDENVMIIFVTSLSQYAVEGYSVRAFDYILKPVAYGSFSSKLTRALRILSYDREETTVLVKTREQTVRLAADAILYVEVSNHDLVIHTGDQLLKQWGSLSKLEEQLKDAHFERCNSCYLVNLKYVRGIQGNQLLVGEDSLTISKSRRKEFLNALAQYKGGSR